MDMELVYYTNQMSTRIHSQDPIGRSTSSCAPDRAVSRQHSR